MFFKKGKQNISSHLKMNERKEKSQSCQGNVESHIMYGRQCLMLVQTGEPENWVSSPHMFGWVSASNGAKGEKREQEGKWRKGRERNYWNLHIFNDLIASSIKKSWHILALFQVSMSTAKIQKAYYKEKHEKPVPSVIFLYCSCFSLRYQVILPQRQQSHI